MPTKAKSIIDKELEEVWDIEMIADARRESQGVPKMTLALAVLITPDGKYGVAHYVPEYGDNDGTSHMKEFISSIKRRKILRKGERLQLMTFQVLQDFVAKAALQDGN